MQQTSIKWLIVSGDRVKHFWWVSQKSTTVWPATNTTHTEIIAKLPGPFRSFNAACENQKKGPGWRNQVGCDVCHRQTIEVTGIHIANWIAVYHLRDCISHTLPLFYSARHCKAGIKNNERGWDLVVLRSTLSRGKNLKIYDNTSSSDRPQPGQMSLLQPQDGYKTRPHQRATGPSKIYYSNTALSVCCAQHMAGVAKVTQQQITTL